MPLPSLSQKLVHLFLSLVALTLVTVTASSLDNVNQQTVFVLAATTIVGVALVRATKLPEDTSREKMSSLVWLERAFGLAGSCAWSCGFNLVPCRLLFPCCEIPNLTLFPLCHF